MYSYSEKRVTEQRKVDSPCTNDFVGTGRSIRILCQKASMSKGWDSNIFTGFPSVLIMAGG